MDVENSCEMRTLIFCISQHFAAQFCDPISIIESHCKLIKILRPLSTKDILIRVTDGFLMLSPH